MNLEETITEHLKNAMKDGNKLRTETLRSIRSQIIEFNKSGAGRELGDADEIKLLNSAAKKRKDAIDMYRSAGRDDLAEKEEGELAIIQEFLPKQLSDEEIEAEIREVILQTGAAGAKDMGKVMGISMKKLSGKAEGGKVQEIVKKLLG